ncbi:MAG: hypothetical protein ACOCQ4_02005, partial [bacterium]
MNQYRCIRPNDIQFRYLLDCVKKGIKTAAKLEYAEQKDVGKFIEILNSNNLYHSVNHNERLCTIYFSKYFQTIENLLKLTKQEKKGNQIATLKIASILGYPDCCARAFLKAKGDDETAIQNAIHKSKDFHTLLNNIETERDYLQFFPCSYDCYPALKIASDILGKDLTQNSYTIDYVNRTEYKRIESSKNNQGKRLYFQNFPISHKQLDIVLGYKCNTRCYYCFSVPTENYLSKEKVLGIINNYGQRGYQRISFNG